MTNALESGPVPGGRNCLPLSTTHPHGSVYANWPAFTANSSSRFRRAMFQTARASTIAVSSERRSTRGSMRATITFVRHASPAPASDSSAYSTPSRARVHCAERASVAPAALHSIGAVRELHQMRQPLVERTAKCETGKANETADPEAGLTAGLGTDLTADLGTDQTADLTTVGESDAAAAVSTTATSAVRTAVKFVFRSAFRSVVRFAFKSGFRFVVKSAV